MANQIKSSESRFGVVAVSVHWISALLILVLLGSGFSAGYASDAETKAAILRVHLPVAVAVLLLTIARLIWWWVALRPQASLRRRCCSLAGSYRALDASGPLRRFVAAAGEWDRSVDLVGIARCPVRRGSLSRAGRTSATGGPRDCRKAAGRACSASRRRCALPSLGAQRWNAQTHLVSKGIAAVGQLQLDSQ